MYLKIEALLCYNYSLETRGRVNFFLKIISVLTKGFICCEKKIIGQTIGFMQTIRHIRWVSITR